MCKTYQQSKEVVFVSLSLIGRRTNCPKYKIVVSSGMGDTFKITSRGVFSVGWDLLTILLTDQLQSLKRKFSFYDILRQLLVYIFYVLCNEQHLTVVAVRSGFGSLHHDVGEKGLI